jgi:hypothetical protein
MPRTLAVVAIVLAASALACPGKRGARSGPGVSDDHFGVYRARLVAPPDDSRKFKALLYAAPPDRLHAEILPPVGGPELILDGGDGRLAVTIASRDAAWVGAASAETLEAVLGFPVTLEGLVGALLEGRPLPSPVELVRSPRDAPGLPRKLELRVDGRELRLELHRTRRRGNGGYPIGTGTPPPGVEVRPLEELLAEDGSFLVRGE